MKIKANHWADMIALEVKQRVEHDKVLKKLVKERGYIVYDEKTPSGKIHIGSGRGWIIHDVIAKAMKDQGLKGRFILSSDDMDPFDKMNKELPVSYKKYLGVPFRDMPSPEKGYKNFGDYYFTQCTNKFEEFGIKAELESTGDRYENGSFNKTIKTALDNANKIAEIFERIYGNPYNKLPFNVKCEKCGKISTTIATEWDKDKEMLKYECRKDLVKWADGCGYKGEVSPYNGNGKFPWKVEWAAKWPTVGVVCETAGKDHFTHGGSRTVAITISNEVFDFPPPYPSTRHATGKGYEFFNVGGKKMSTSKGAGIGFVESTDYAPAQLLRYMLTKTRPHAALDFDPSGTNAVILLYDRYDKDERIYHEKEKLDNKDELAKIKRIFEFSHIGKIGKMPHQVSFLHCAITIQAAITTKRAIELLKKTGHIPKKISKEELAYVEDRLDFARKWVNNFAEEQFKFQLKDRVDVKVPANIKKSLLILAELMKKNKYNEKSLYEEFYNICEKTDVEPKEFFKWSYKVLTGKEQGPRLAPFILTVGKDKVIKLFKQL